MKQLIYNLLATSLTLLLFVSTQAFAQLKTEDFVKLQNDVQKDVERVIKKFDPEAHVIVSIKSAKLKDPLPTTPFAFKNLNLKTEKGNIKLKKIYVKIYSKAPSLPGPLRKIIKETVKKYGATPKISLRPLPGSIDTFIKKFLDRYLLTLAAGLLGIAVMFMFILIATRKKGSSKMQEILDQGMGKIASSLENGLSQQSSGAGADAQARVAASDSANNSNEQFLEELDAKGYAALLTDCYWGEFDSYAAYIWSYVPLKRRKEVLRQNTFLETYASYFANIPKENLGMHDDPYYLKPAPITKIDNKDLVKACQQNAGFYGSLSVMRKEGLVLSSRDQIKFLSESANEVQNLIKKLSSFADSPLRVLEAKVTFKIHSVEEENDILTMKHLTKKLKAQIPTLGWAMDLTNEKISEILTPYSAEELASAWLAPDNVLEKFKSCLPEKKYDLMSSYLERSNPNRNSATFKSLLKTIVTSLPESDTNENEETILKAA